jgi:hypothetical protein
MQVITGRICKFLHDSVGGVNGFSLDITVDICFPSDQAARVLAVVRAGSRVEIHARMRGGLTGGACAEARFITNVDSGQSVDLPDPPTPHSPEVSTYVYASPREETPLAPAFETVLALQSSATSSDVAGEIERAHSGLHRIQAILVYLNMTNQKTSSLNEYLDEAEHTFVQALSRYEARDFEGARECVAASGGLSRLIEILISRTIRSNADHPKFMPSPPEHAIARGEKEAAQNDLDGVERLLARVRWVTENGTLPSEDRAQVQRLSSWGGRFCHWARRFLDTGALEDATEFAQAAGAAVSSADHLCKKCYVTQSVASQPASASNKFVPGRFQY